jgi:1,2-diacylglycerol 3-alpha-glucosyltransferase
MTNKKPTVIITSNLYKPFIGGVENSLHHLALSYVELGYKPIIVVSDLTTKDEDLQAYECQDGIDIYRYRMSSNIKFCGIKLPLAISATLELIALYKKVNLKYQPEFLISRYHYNQLIAKLSGMKNTLYLVPGIVKYQNSTKNNGKQNFRSWFQWHFNLILQYWALISSDRIAVFSENMLDQVNDVLPQKIRPLLTKPGVDHQRFTPLNRLEKSQGRNNYHLDHQGTVFLCVGRCVKAKGFDIVINAFSKIQSRDAQLWIVGNGPLMDEYQSQVKQLELASRVIFMGAQSQPEKYYQLADFFVMSSIYEPLGQTILEAMSSGLPVIAFTASEEVQTATSELLSDKHAVFIAKPDAQLLANTIDRLIEWPDNVYQQKVNMSRQHVIDQFTWTNLASTLAGEFSANNVNPLISVYIPSKNRVHLLKRAVDSVLAQTYNNIEVIIVDDGSTDGTEHYLKQLKIQHKNVKVITLSMTMGAPEARNHAIKLATGELITGLDDDDYFLPDRIKNLVNAYDPKYAFICSGYYWNYGKIKSKANKSIKVINLDEQLHLNHASNQVLIARKRLIEVGGFDTQFNSCQDWELWTRIIAKYGNALRISALDYVVDVSHGNHRITDNVNRVSGFRQYLLKFSEHMKPSHLKSLQFQIAMAEGENLSLPKTISLMTLPLWQRNLKYWLSCKFPKIAKWRLNSLK